ncbi:M23 family metallopeptidase [Hwanghaeella grinnelliae]|uniref:M23 family metallopeptidase n=1 Tax=Hwanghaeella grinnelliae TaxID=2500179 RepID=A0A3S2VPE8_9PROT|nr:M23 family metallopeptidase [Hwanghaeella grinnelliae]RVU38498.1 M23 family metallopeptidase [Hwanghaeella grinnelliae]
MRTLFAIVGLIVLGALGALGFLYAQENPNSGVASLIAKISGTFGQSDGPSPDATATVKTDKKNVQADDETGPLKFRMPARCKIGRTCLVQHFVDTESGADAKDFKCGTLTTSGNQGTHFRLPGPQEMQKGVPVVAAASGEVIRVRDGLPDVDVTLVGRDALGSSGFGNVVLLKHRDGYLSAYGHLKRGSVVVAKGQAVRAGQKLGEIGLSGATDFPHLHFEIRKDGKVIDPFTGLEAESGCGKTGDPLWNQAALEQLTYFPSAVLRIGFASVELNQAALEYGLLAGDGALSGKSGRLVFHVYAAGLRAGDKARFEIQGPSGDVLTETEETVLEDSPTAIFRTGPPDLGSALKPGSYRGIFTLMRDENGLLKPALTAEASVSVN